MMPTLLGRLLMRLFPSIPALTHNLPVGIFSERQIALNDGEAVRSPSLPHLPSPSPSTCRLPAAHRSCLLSHIVIHPR